jgi:hypothetical protein
MFMLAPGVSEDKIRQSIRLLGKKAQSLESFKASLDKDQQRTTLRDRIRALKETKIREVRLTEEDEQNIVKRFLEEHPKLLPRHQRDFPRLIALIRGSALLNFVSRRYADNAIYANADDIEAGYSLYKEIAESNEMGISPDLWRFYCDLLQDKLDPETGLSRSEFRGFWYEYSGSRLGDKAIVRRIEELEEANLIVQKDDPDDRRRTRLYAP